MNGKTQIKLGKDIIPLHFNNFAKVELGKMLLTSKGVFPPKPEELELLDAIDKMSKENHLLLLSRIIYAGIIGDRYAKDQVMNISRSDINGMVAEADQEDLYSCWFLFLEAMGMNLDAMIKANRDAEKKLKETEKEIGKKKMIP